MAHVFVIDNYDSFTYNLVQLLGTLGAEVTVARNDQVSIPEIEATRPTHLLVSPGPCTPAEAGVSVEAIRFFAKRGVPVLGVCLGHQCIAVAFGATVQRADAVVHGKTDRISHDGRGLFAGLPEPFTATRYHSLVVDPALPPALERSAWNEAGEVMGVRHRQLPIDGVQFHPESVLTEHGAVLLANFLGIAAAGSSGVTAEGTQTMPNDILSAALKRLVGGGDLSENEAREVLLEIMGGGVGDAQTAAL
ncbi:MAG: gamma-glutamyl-gamma-aminobutyrate hydrolase family protein, partial [Thermoleophilia bacterium]